MIELDEDAEQLFRELGGLDSARKLENFAEIADLLADCLKAEEERLDKWRVQLVEAAHLVSSYFVDVRFSEGIRKNTGTFDELLGAFTRLSSMPDRNRSDSILSKFRGHPKGGRSPRKSTTWRHSETSSWTWPSRGRCSTVSGCA